MGSAHNRDGQLPFTRCGRGEFDDIAPEVEGAAETRTSGSSSAKVAARSGYSTPR